MSMGKFTISTDSCVDVFKSYLEENKVHYIILKRITDGEAKEELYDTFGEYESFYDDIRRGKLPTTSQLSPYEIGEYFKSLLEKEEGDIIHLPLSSGLSNTCLNAENAAAELNKSLSGRKIYVVDTLSATMGMAMLVDRLIEMRDAGMETAEAAARIAEIRDRQQLWAMLGDLFHLRRGGRLSGFKATIGTLLKVKPILVINNVGKLSIESTVKGTQKAMNYVLGKMEKAAEAGFDFTKNPIYVMHSSDNELCDHFISAVKEKFGDNVLIKKGMLGPIIGTHIGVGTVAVVFEADARLDIPGG